MRQGSIESGFTLLELLIAMTLGVLIIAGMVQLYGSVVSGATTANQASSLSETGTIALYRITDSIRQAGYGEICCSNTSTNIGQTLFAGIDIRGCAGHPFADATTFACDTTTPGSDTVVTRFQANSADTVTAASQATVADCTGQVSGTGTSSQNGAINMVQNIYSLDATNARVICSNGTPNTPAVTLVPDVSDMRLFYGFDDAGFAAANQGTATALPVATTFLTADQISAKQNGVISPWTYVVAVDLCLDMRSSLDSAAVSPKDSYVRCPHTDAEAASGAPRVTITDHRLHRAFRKLITIRAHANSDPTLEVAVSTPSGSKK